MAEVSGTQRLVAEDENVVTVRRSSDLQVGLQGVHGRSAQEHDPVFEPLGLLDACPSAFQVQV